MLSGSDLRAGDRMNHGVRLHIICPFPYYLSLTHFCLRTIMISRHSSDEEPDATIESIYTGHIVLVCVLQIGQRKAIHFPVWSNVNYVYI